MSGTAVLTAKSICLSYANVHALKNINLNIKSGEITILLGSSGAGKSSLLKTLNLLNQPTRGIISNLSLGRIDSSRKLRDHRKMTGMIFQQHQLIERNTALDNVMIGRLGYFSFWRSLFPLPAYDQLLCLDCLDRVGLLDKALTTVSSLSGGQQQRVGIARALAQQPRIMLADEPIASLDPQSSHQILSLLSNICKSDNIAMVISLHQVEFAKQYGDRIIGLSDGKISCDDNPSSLSNDDFKAIYNQSLK